MKFIHFDLGFQARGNVVEVTLSGSANVSLLDTPNFERYRTRRRHTYYGGRAIASPVNLTIPHNDHWHVTVDMRALRGSVTASYKVIPHVPQGPLPEVSLAPLPPPSPEVAPREIESLVNYDVFISHASEDKYEVVRPLADALREHGLRVWYDEFELRMGDSLRKKIDYGLANSRYGVVVLSQAFFAKKWPQYELDGLVTREMTGEQVILPLWHRITKEEVIKQSPPLADKVARNTGDATIDEIALEIADVIREER